MGGAAKSAEAAATEQVTVSPRRTVFDGARHHGPGTILTLAKNEAARLRGLGFLQDPAAAADADEATAGQAEAPAAIAAEEPGPTINGEAATLVKPK